jgi:hypothetical protein
LILILLPFLLARSNSNSVSSLISVSYFIFILIFKQFFF